MAQNAKGYRLSAAEELTGSNTIRPYHNLCI